MPERAVVIGTRGSALAMWQAAWAKSALEAAFPGRSFVLKQLQTRGDIDHRSALASIGTTGVFVKEIEAALLSGEIDLAVHSLKDLPSDLQDGLTLAAVSPREDPRDAVVSRDGLGLMALPAGARLGTSSPRRAAQVMALRQDLLVGNIRGNVDTRIRKVMDGSFDASILAAAGIHRLGLGERIAEYLPPSVMLPAPCQGIVALEAREGDEAIGGMARQIDDRAAHLSARAERAYVRALGGGCATPLAAYARVDGEGIEMRVLLASPDGDRLIRHGATGDAAAAEEIGERLARLVLGSGGAEILDQIRESEGEAP